MKPLCIALLTAILIPAAHAQDPAAAKRFVQQVYANYADHSVNRQTKRENAFYTPQLRRLIATDRSSHPGNVGKLDGNPICDCQDPGEPGELKVQSITLAAVTPRTVKATVQFTIVKDSRTVILLLHTAPSGWLIDDISSADTPSLRGLLRKK